MFDDFNLAVRQKFFSIGKLESPPIPFLREYGSFLGQSVKRLLLNG